METTLHAKLRKGNGPLYLQLASILHERLDSGEYKPGDLLPTEGRLAKQFGVSLITVREALRQLVAEGLISRHSGRGTFVTQKPTRITYRAASSIEDLYTFGGDVEALADGESHVTTRECLGRSTVPADKRVSELLRVPLGSQVVEVKVRIFVDDTPLGYVVSCVPSRLGRKIPAERLENTALVLLLSELCDTRIVRADQWTIASSASRDLSELLEIRLGDPVLTFRRVYFDRQGCPVQTSSATFRGDRFRQYLHLRPAVQGSESVGPEAPDPMFRPGEECASIPLAGTRAVHIV